MTNLNHHNFLSSLQSTKKKLRANKEQAEKLEEDEVRSIVEDALGSMENAVDIVEKKTKDKSIGDLE